MSNSSKKFSANPPDKTRNLWGRRIGRPLRGDRALALENLLPVVGIEKDFLAQSTNLSPSTFFSLSPTPLPLKKGEREVWLEIGFGNGDHLLALMEKYPSVNFLGAEPFINGVSSLLLGLKNRGSHDNIRILMDDALFLVRALADNSLERIYILNPDPWPKVRHHKRRIISQANLTEFARILKPGGKLVMATDVDDLAEWMVTQCMNHPAFEWEANSAKDWQTPPAEWIETRFAFKGRQAGRRQTFLLFKKLAKPQK